MNADLNTRVSDLTPLLNRVNRIVAVRYETRVLSDHFDGLNTTAVKGYETFFNPELIGPPPEVTADLIR